MKKTIIHVTYDFFPKPLWGVASHVFSLAKEQAKLGYEPIIVTRNRSSIEMVNRYYGLRVIHCEAEADSMLLSDKYQDTESYKDLDLVMAWNAHLVGVMRNKFESLNIRPYIIHNHSWMTWKAAKEIGREYGAQTVSSIHFLEGQYVGTGNSTTVIDHPEISRIEQEMLQDSEWIIGFSKMTLNVLKTHYQNSFRPNKITVIPHGINLDSIKVHTQKKNRGPIRIVFAGRLVKEKGIHLLLPVMKKLSEKYNVELHVVGDGIDLDKLKTKFQSEEIIFHGHLPKKDLFKIYSKADVLCQPSLTETFGLSVAEGMAFGLPIVTTRGNTMPEIVRDRKTGLLINLKYRKEISFSKDALYLALEELIINGNLRRKLSKNARQYALRHLGSARMAKHTLNVYKRVRSATL